MDLSRAFFALDLAGVAVFAASGAIVAGRKRMDVFGVLVLATATALGGGTLRDLVLDVTPVSWVAQPVYLATAAAAAVVTMATRRIWSLLARPYVVADAIGLACFCVLGAERAASAGAGETVTVVMGVVTAVAGGMIRDVLAGEVPLVLRRELHATAALAGALTYRLAHGLGVPSPLGAVLGMGVALGLRLAALRFGLSLPVFEGHDRPSPRPPG